jgi:hypothetical protein
MESDAMLCTSHMKAIDVSVDVQFRVETQRNSKVFVTQIVVA